MIDINANAGWMTDIWWITTAKDYTITIGLALFTGWTILQIIAILHPGDKTNSIIKLLELWGAKIPIFKKTGSEEKQDLEEARK